MVFFFKIMYNTESKNHKRYLYERITMLFHYQILYSISFFLVAQVIYINFHYIIGSIISIISVSNIIIQNILSLIEYYYLSKGNHYNIDILFNKHTIYNNIVLLLCTPFIIWTIVLVFQK